MNRILGILVSLLIYAGGIFIGGGIFSFMDFNLVFAATGFVQTYLYLGIAALAALLTISLLSLSFRNLSLVKMFPGLVGPMCYIAMFFYYKVYNIGTIFPLVIMCIYCLYIFLRGVITMDDVSSLDGKVAMMKDKHPNTYPLIYVPLGILIPSILGFFAFLPSVYYIQTSFLNAPFELAFYDVIAWVLMILGMGFSIVVDVPLFFNKLKRGDDYLYKGGLWGKMKHPNVIGDMVYYLGAIIFIFHFSNMYAFILFPIALFVYVHFVIYPYCFKADSLYLIGYKEKWGKRK